MSGITDGTFARRLMEIARLPPGPETVVTVLDEQFALTGFDVTQSGYHGDMFTVTLDLVPISPTASSPALAGSVAVQSKPKRKSKPKPKKKTAEEQFEDALIALRRA